jgi:hypothetical protein
VSAAASALPLVGQFGVGFLGDLPDERPEPSPTKGKPYFGPGTRHREVDVLAFEAQCRDRMSAELGAADTTNLGKSPQKNATGETVRCASPE